MSNPSKKRGSQWESAVVNYLRDWVNPRVERRALSGRNDKGDIAGMPSVVVEAKNAAKVELAAWLDEAKTEGRNAGAQVAVAWFKRRGKTSPGDGFVLMDGTTFTFLLREAGLSGWQEPRP